jgi:hypothetical protein
MATVTHGRPSILPVLTWSSDCNLTAHRAADSPDELFPERLSAENVEKVRVDSAVLSIDMRPLSLSFIANWTDRERERERERRHEKGGEQRNMKPASK